MSYDQTPWMAELSKIVFPTVWLLHPVPHWCPRGSQCTTCEHQDCVTARPTVVCLIQFRLKILDVAEIYTTPYPFNLTFMSRSQLIILQTSANFCNVLKTWSSFCGRLDCDSNILAWSWMTTSFHLYFSLLTEMLTLLEYGSKGFCKFSISGFVMNSWHMTS